MSSNASEKEKMLSGELYFAMDPELAKEREQCRVLIHGYNTAAPDDFAKRAKVLKQLLGAYHKTALIEPPFRCDYGYNISVGKAFYANFDCVFLDVAPISIGDNVMLGPGVHIYAATHPIDPTIRITYKELGKSITIGNNVWIGGKSVICPGVSIGDNSVIGAGSVVTKNVPARVVVAGNPARILREI